MPPLHNIKRKRVPNRTRALILDRQGHRCAITGLPLDDPKKIRWDHNPALELRPINDDGTDYIPPQLDPDFLQAVLDTAHDVKTDGAPVEKKHMLAKNYDKARIAKTKRVREGHVEWRASFLKKECGQKRKKSGRWPSRSFSQGR